jgi:hypothetical protein
MSSAMPVNVVETQRIEGRTVGRGFMASGLENLMPSLIRRQDAADEQKSITSDARDLAFRLVCTTDAALYDLWLTIELIPPVTWAPSTITIRNAQGAAIPVIPGKPGEREVLRFRVPPREASSSIKTGS